VLTSFVRRPSTLTSSSEPSLGPSRIWAAIGTVCLGYFLVYWAMNPIASILPTVARELDVGVAEIGWVLSFYFLMLVGSAMLMGRIGDLHGHGRVFAVGAAIYSVASVLCAAANDFSLLLVARGIQGVASAMVFGTSLAIMANSVPVAYRGRAIGFLTVAAALAALVGVPLSTWAVQNLSWHWAFVFPIPVGIAATLAGLRLSPALPHQGSRGIDWLGGLLLFGVVTSLMLGINHLHEGAETFQDGAPWHLGMHLVAAVLLVVLIRVERRVPEPLIDLKLLANRDFASAMLANGLAHMSMLAITFIVPFLLERGRGMTPAETRQLLIWQQVAMLSGSVAAGYLYDRLRSPLLAVAALAGIALGLGLYGTQGGTLDLALLVCVAITVGGALGGFTTVNNTIIMALAPAHRRGFVSGMVESTRQLGHGLGVSISSSFMASVLAQTASPGPADYVAGFQQAALAMALISSLAALCVLYPKLQPRVWGRFASRVAPL
jgi:predicted MFS family arabinose efflux permease